MFLVRGSCCASDPLLRRRSLTDDAPPAHTVDQFVSLGRAAKSWWPSRLTLSPLLLLTPAYAVSSMLILQPTFLDERLSADFNVDEQVLAAVSMAFFGCWGIGTFFITRFADRYGRKPAALGCVIAATTLSAICAAAPFFPVYAISRALLGAPVGAAGGITYLLCVEWALPADNGVLTSLMMVVWSLCAAALPGLIYLTDEVHASWRIQQLMLSGIMALPLLTVPFVLESPRFHLASGRTEVAEALLWKACERGRVHVPDGSRLVPLEAPSCAAPQQEQPQQPQQQPALDSANAAAAAVQDVTIINSLHSPESGGGSSRRATCCPPQLTSPSTVWKLLLVGLNWLAVALLFYGLDFSEGSQEGDKDQNKYIHAALTSLVDIPGYLIGSLLADTRLGRRLTAALSLLLGGSCLLLTAAAEASLPHDRASSVASGLTLAGKLCAASAFVQAYLFPAEMFSTTIRATALGIANVFARTGAMLAPLAETAPAAVVRLGLGGLSLLAGGATLLLPERRGEALPD